MTTPLVDATALTVEYRQRGGLMRRPPPLRAVDGVSLSVGRGESLGLVGESGSGKSTTGYAILRLVRLASGTIRFDGIDITSWGERQLRTVRRRMQLVFQDPYGSLNPRMKIGASLSEPLEIHGLVPRARRAERVGELLETVGLSPEMAGRYPHAFSGGQRQRIAIARALAAEPDLIICDEPTSALDVSIRAQILNLLKDLRAEAGTAYLLISHDLAAVRYVADRVAVMYLGRIVEIGPTGTILHDPRHPYTVVLTSATLSPHPGRTRAAQPLATATPEAPADAVVEGCRFRPRCWLYERLGRPEECRAVDPPLLTVSGEHASACHFHSAVPSHRDDPVR